MGPHEGPHLRGLPQQELLRRLTIHQRVIEEVMERGDVLPARFGTVLASEDEVRSILTRWGGLVQSLARFSGLIEVEAVATWDLGRTLALIAVEPEVVAAKAAAGQAAPEERLAQQVQVGQLVKRALDKRRALCQEKLLQEVGSLANGVQPNAVWRTNWSSTSRSSWSDRRCRPSTPLSNDWMRRWRVRSRFAVSARFPLQLRHGQRYAV